MSIIALLALCVAAASAVPANNQRIVGGSTTTINAYPSMVSLRYTTNGLFFDHQCGGTILNNRAVLTAGHCVFGELPSRWRARIGFAELNPPVHSNFHVITNIIVHPSFDTRTYDNDIAVLHSATTFIFNNFVQPASISGPNYNLADNQVVWAAGWGVTSEGGAISEHLRHAQIWTINHNQCRINYMYLGSSFIVITENMLCAGMLSGSGVGQCQGDAGGPLFHNGVVVGVYSFGGCGRMGLPGVNTKISNYSSWIQSNA